jgi:hypothetical protein
MVVASTNDLLACFFLAMAANSRPLKSAGLIDRGQMPGMALQWILRGAVFFPLRGATTARILL